MTLPDAPIAHEGFLAVHFFTVSDQENRRTFWSAFLAKSDPRGTLLYQAGQYCLLLNSGGGPTACDLQELTSGLHSATPAPTYPSFGRRRA